MLHANFVVVQIKQLLLLHFVWAGSHERFSYNQSIKLMENLEVGN